ncbi:hypothetical protein HMPREF1568_2359 [Providencia alcalifaciens PAL-3]|nr:hypothetical protein HMPREF1568_2359 [Providencia alcalifaciens PAL-3]EUC98388.1 hypothetical protein HMPREF1566_0058 [Providencia alcalifaciens PAL-1]
MFHFCFMKQYIDSMKHANQLVKKWLSCHIKIKTFILLIFKT